MLDEFLKKEFLGNTVFDYITFALILILGFILIKIAKAILTSYLKKIARRLKVGFDEVLLKILNKMVMPLVYFGLFYLATRGLFLHQTLSKIIDIIGIALLTLIAVRMVMMLIEYLLKDYWQKKAPDASRISTVNALLPAIRVVVWGIGLVFLLDNLGFEISAVIAGLGIGGVAIALASQAVLGDMFNYFAILFDKPFEVGDFIIVGDFLGSIEHIGIKTTRLRSLGGEQLVFSNTDLTSTRIRNYKRMQKRRVLFRLGVIYQTAVSQMKEIPDIIKGIIENTEGTTFERAHFASFGDFSLVIEVVYYVLSPDYNVYMDTQQKINYDIMEEFEKRGLEFAYPTQTIFLEKPNASETSVS